MIAPRTRTVLAAALLVTATLLAFSPVWHGGFIFDDDVFLTDNPLIRAADGLRRLWLSREPADYWPLSSSTLWLEWRAWGAHPVGYHVTNLALHVVEVLLFWAVLRRLKMPGATVAAMVFALHPLNAETVAWITQRKNLVAMLFYLVTVWLFVAAEEEMSAKGPRTESQPYPKTDGGRAGTPLPADSDRRKHSTWYYGASLIAFALGMLSKSSVVTLPFVLAGIVAWRRRPTRRDILRLAPYFAIAVGLTLFQSAFSTVLDAGEAAPIGLAARIARAAAIFLFYIGKMLWPANLSFDYGPWHGQAHVIATWLPLIVLAGATMLLWRYRASATRTLLAAWLFIGVSLLPVLGFVEVGFMKYSPVSNHYAHIALLGFAALCGAGWERANAIVENMPGGPTARRGVAAAGILALGGLTWAQAHVYSDATLLYEDTLQHNSASWLAQTNLGAMAEQRGDLAEARRHLDAAVKLKPGFAPAHNELGIVLYRSNDLSGAIHEYREAIRLNPYLYQARNNLGAALARFGDLAGAIEQFETALRLVPDFESAKANLAKARQRL